MRSVWLLLLLVACPPVDTACRTFVSVRPQPTSLLIVADVPQRVAFVFDGPFCSLPEGIVSVLPTMSAPSGAPVAVVVERLRQGTDNRARSATIEFDLVFPPIAAGTYFLKLFVEPTIGALQIPVYVAADRRVDPGVPVSFTEPCLSPARTRDGTTFCHADGGFTAYRGSQRTLLPGIEKLVTVGNVVWMRVGDEVRRYEDRPDAGLMLTAKTLVLEARGTIFANETVAVARNILANPSMNRFRYLPPSDVLTSDFIQLYGRSVWLEGDQAFEIASANGVCSNRQCGLPRQESTGFVGADRHFVWLSERLPGFLTTELALLKRPVSLDAGADITLPIPPGWSSLDHRARGLMSPDEMGGDLPPMLFPDDDAGVRAMLLLRQTPEGTAMDLFPEEVQGSSRDWLIFRGKTRNELRFVALPLSP